MGLKSYVVEVLVASATHLAVMFLKLDLNLLNFTYPKPPLQREFVTGFSF